MDSGLALALSITALLVGLAAGKANDWGTAVAGFTGAVELKPDFAYAHYYAALAYQRQRQLSKTAEHFDAFLRLAPDAPAAADAGATTQLPRDVRPTNYDVEVVPHADRMTFDGKVRIKGSHHFLQHPDGRCTVVPVHAGETLGPSLLGKILKDVEIDPDEFRTLL